jgi:zinc protease
LSSGLRVLLLEQHNLPIVRVDVVVRGGWADLRSDPVFVAKAVGALLEKGTTTRSAIEIASGYEALGAEHWTRVDLDSATASAKVLASKLEPALDLLQDVVQHPAFPVGEVELLKGRWADGIAQQKLEVDTLAWNATHMALYGRKHPYGHASIATPGEVASITPAALRHAYARAFAMQRASIVVVGDTTRESVLPGLERAFGGWKRGPDVVVQAPRSAVPEATARIALIDRPGVTQSLVYLAEIAASWSSPDRDAFEIMDVILGGFWMSRLNADLRERLGYSYWASSSGDLRRGAGPFRAGGSMHAENTGESIVELLKEVRKMTVEEPTAEELDGAKQFTTRWIVAKFETTSRSAREIDQMVTYDLPVDEPVRLAARLRSVSAADVQRVALKYLHPDTMKILVIGDRAKVEPQLAGLGLGRVEIRDAYGNVVNSTR